MKRTLPLIICLFGCFLLHAKNLQNTSVVKGRIVDAKNNTPLEFVTMALSNDSAGTKILSQTASGADGYFTLAFPVSADSARLLIHYIGYRPYCSETLYKKSGAIQLGDIRMQPLSLELGTVEVLADKKQVIYKLDKRIIDASGFGAASAGTAVDVLENTPSFRVDAEGQVTFRGSSGFKVYIDGKPSIFNGTEGLEQVPANQIENIEVITTPSARYETDGDVGIINIITKKDYKTPLSGVINVMGSSLLSRGVNLQINQNKNKWDWHAGANVQNIFRKSHFDQQKTTYISDTLTTSTANGTRKGNTYRYTLNAGAGYKFTEATYFSLDIEGGYAGNARHGDLDYSDSAYYASSATHLKHNYSSLDNYDIHETYYQWNLQGTHKFDKEGHELSGRIYGKYGGNAVEKFESELYDKNGNNNFVDGHTAIEAEYRWTVKGNLDYVLPFKNKKGKFEGGLMYDYYMEDGDYTLTFRESPSLPSSIYTFKQSIYSVYSQVTHEVGRFMYQLGLRGEQTRRLLDSNEPGASNIWKKFEFFPSAHVMYTFPNEHILSAGYSRRTTRAQLFFMEPYVTYIDYYTASVGNPYIQPEYTNSVELGYRKSFGKHSVAVTAFHRARKDKIERVRLAYKPGMTIDSMANVGNDYSSGIEASGNFELLNWWSIVANGSLYDYRIKNEFKMVDDDTNSLNWQIGLNNSFNVTKTTRIQLDANYVGPSVSTQGQVNAYFYMNLSARQQFFNRKLAATLALRDVLCTARFKNHISATGLDSRTTVRPYSPMLTLSLSYTFNDFSLKKNGSGESDDLFEGSRH